MCDPQLILADEPVASLDPRISRDILGLLRNTVHEQGVAVLCTLHQVELALEFADRIVGLRLGRVVFDGVPSEFDAAAHASLYSALDPHVRTDPANADARAPLLREWAHA
jgi:phosphonate transport system ATP-binding protein